MLKRTTPPACDPVLLGAAKRHVVVSSDDDNLLLASLVTAATQFVEDLTARQFLPATWRLTADRFCEIEELRICPVASVEAVRYYDADGQQQTLDESDYIVDLASEPARIRPAYGTCWPSIQRRIAAVEVDFVAGWPDRFEVPASAKQAVLLLVGHWFANREAVGTVGPEIALTFSSLVWSLKWSL